MEHAGGIRRGVASICDGSFDLISILEKLDLGSNSYIGVQIFFFWNRFLKIDLGQTAPPKMTTMIIGWHPVFGETMDLTRFFIEEISISQANLDFNFIYNCIISSGINILGASCIFGRTLAEPSTKLHLLRENNFRISRRTRCWRRPATKTNLQLPPRPRSWDKGCRKSNPNFEVGTRWDARCFLINTFNRMDPNSFGGIPGRDRRLQCR